MKFSKHFFYLLTFFLLLNVSCSKNSNSSDKNNPVDFRQLENAPAEPNQRTGFDGVWNTRCQNDFSYLDGRPLNHFAAPAYQIASYTISGNRVVFTISQYSDFRCSTFGSFLIKLDGQFDIRRFLPEERGAAEVALRFDTCSGICSQYIPQVSGAYSNDIKLFKLDSNQLFVGSQSPNGSLLWDYNEPFYLNTANDYPNSSSNKKNK